MDLTEVINMVQAIRTTVDELHGALELLETKLDELQEGGDE